MFTKLPYVILVGITLALLLGHQLVQGVQPNTSEEVKAVEATIQRSQIVNAEVEYTFNTALLATVYINDPRGGEMPPAALQRIQEVRGNNAIRADQVGYLDHKQAVIESNKRNYERYIADLRAKETAGTLTLEERAILTGEPVPEATPTEIFVSTQRPEVLSFSGASYPGPWPATPVLLPTAAYPGPSQMPPVLRATGPTSTPPPPPLIVPYRGPDPSAYSPDDLSVRVLSVEIEGDVAKAVISKSGVTSELVLVRVDGQWYIAGGRLLRFEP